MRDSPAPDVRSPVETTVLLHPTGDIQILRSMVSMDSAGNAIARGGLLEKLEHCLGTVIGMNSRAGNAARATIDERVVDELPADEA